MAFDQLDTVPRDAFIEQDHAAMQANIEKSGLKETVRHQFGQAARHPAAMQQEPNDNAEQKQQQTIDPQEFNVQAQCAGAFLQDCRVGPKADSFFGVACTEMSNDIQGIAQSLRGQPAVAPQDLAMNQTLQMNYAPRPSMGGLFS